jgi:glycosyltransferase involved in cell wall biosynthesis
MKNVHVRGPLLSKSGYGTHARQIAKWLDSRGTVFAAEVTPWGITPWYLDSGAENGLIGKVMSYSGTRFPQTDVSIQIQLPHEWTPGLAKFNVGVTAGVETDKVSSIWVDSVMKMDKVIVPSKFSKEGFVKAGVPSEKIDVVPESFNEWLERGKSPRDIDLTGISTKFNFLTFGQMTGNNPETDRKNLLYTVKWFCEEFKGNKDVGLIVKSNLGTNCIYHKIQLKQMFEALLREVRQGEFPSVYLLNGEIDQEECATLYRHPKVNCMLSFTRGEGYGLPLVDAAAAGLPVIATEWSGHLDFLNLGKFSRVPYDLVEVSEKLHDEKIFVKGARWAMPREADAKKKMRKMVESHHTPREWASELSTKVQDNLNQKRVESIYEEILGGLL